MTEQNVSDTMGNMNSPDIRKGQIWFDPATETHVEVLAVGPQLVIGADIDNEGGLIDLHPIVFKSMTLIPDWSSE